MADEGSDVDVAVIHGDDEGKVIEKVAEAALDTMLKYHIPIKPVTISIHERAADNPFLKEVEKEGRVLFSIDPEGERGMVTRDYYAIALEWLKYAKEAMERSEVRLAMDAGYNAAELMVKALILRKGGSLARSH